MSSKSQSRSASRVQFASPRNSFLRRSMSSILRIGGMKQDPAHSSIVMPSASTSWPNTMSPGSIPRVALRSRIFRSSPVKRSRAFEAAARIAPQDLMKTEGRLETPLEIAPHHGVQTPSGVLEEKLRRDALVKGGAHGRRRIVRVRRPAVKEPRHEERQVRRLWVEGILQPRELRPGLVRRPGAVCGHHELEQRLPHRKVIDRSPQPTPGERPRGLERRVSGTQTATLGFLAAAARAGIIATGCSHGGWAILRCTEAIVALPGRPKRALSPPPCIHRQNKASFIIVLTKLNKPLEWPDAISQRTTHARSAQENGASRRSTSMWEDDTRQVSAR